MVVALLDRGYPPRGQKSLCSPKSQRGHFMANFKITSASLQSIAADMGVSSSDFITSDNTLVFSGKYSTNSGTGTDTLKIYLVPGAVNQNGFQESNFTPIQTRTVTQAQSNIPWTVDYTGHTLADGVYTVVLTGAQGEVP